MVVSQQGSAANEDAGARPALPRSLSRNDSKQSRTSLKNAKPQRVWPPPADTSQSRLYSLQGMYAAFQEAVSDHEPPPKGSLDSGHRLRSIYEELARAQSGNMGDEDPASMHQYDMDMDMGDAWHSSSRLPPLSNTNRTSAPSAEAYGWYAASPTSSGQQDSMQMGTPPRRGKGPRQARSAPEHRPQLPPWQPAGAEPRRAPHRRGAADAAGGPSLPRSDKGNTTVMAEIQLIANAPAIAPAARAVHPLFLLGVLLHGLPTTPSHIVTGSRTRAPGVAGSQVLRPGRSMTTAEFVARTVRPSLGATRIAYVHALGCNAAEVAWCPGGKLCAGLQAGGVEGGRRQSFGAGSWSGYGSGGYGGSRWSSMGHSLPTTPTSITLELEGVDGPHVAHVGSGAHSQLQGVNAHPTLTIPLPADLQGKPVNGPAAFFVSHAWHYSFRDLVVAVLQHYLQMPEVVRTGGTKFVPVFYWVDMFALPQFERPCHELKHQPQHFLAQVMGACKGLVLVLPQPTAAVHVMGRVTMSGGQVGDRSSSERPLKRLDVAWTSAAAPTAALGRAWCLHEVVLARACGVGVQVVMMGSGRATAQLAQQAGGDGVRLWVDAVDELLGALDLTRAQATIKFDHAYIMSQAMLWYGGYAGFNSTLRAFLRPHLLAALLSDLLAPMLPPLADPALVGAQSRAPTHSGAAAPAAAASATAAATAAAAATDVGGDIVNWRAALQVVLAGAFLQWPAPSMCVAMAVDDNGAADVAAEFFGTALTTVAPRDTGAVGAAAGAHTSHSNALQDLEFAPPPPPPQHPKDILAQPPASPPSPEAGSPRSRASSPTLPQGDAAAASASSSPTLTPGSPPQSSRRTPSGVARGRRPPNRRASMRRPRNPTVWKSVADATAEGMDAARLRLTGDGVASLMPGLQANTHLTRLVLSGHHIGSEGGIHLGEGLRDAPGVLRMLLLRGCRLGAECGPALAGMLGACPCLACLDLGENPDLGPQGVTALAVGVACSGGLRELWLDGSDMGTEGAIALWDAVAAQACQGPTVLPPTLAAAVPALQMQGPARRGSSGTDAGLGIGGQAVGAKSGAQAQEGGRGTLGGPSYGPCGLGGVLEVLDMRGNGIGVGAAEAIASALRCPTVRLRVLLLGDNILETEGALAIASALPHCRTLRELELRDNQLALEVGAALGTVLGGGPVFGAAPPEEADQVEARRAMRKARARPPEEAGVEVKGLGGGWQGSDDSGDEEGVEGGGRVLPPLRPSLGFDLAGVSDGEGRGGRGGGPPCGVEVLDLGGNPLLGDVGVEALVEGLLQGAGGRRSSSGGMGGAWVWVKEIRLDGCGLGPQGAAALARLVAEGVAPSGGRSRATGTGRSGMTRPLAPSTLPAAVRARGSTKAGGEGGGGVGWGAWGSGMGPDHPGLTSLDISHNNIGAEGALALASTVPSMRTLRVFVAQSCGMGVEGRLSLLAGLQLYASCPLRQLDLRGNGQDPEVYVPPLLTAKLAGHGQDVQAGGLSKAEAAILAMTAHAAAQQAQAEEELLHYEMGLAQVLNMARQLESSREGFKVML